MSDRRLTLLVHGEPGSGKSWLFNSAPGPRLLLDAEGRAEHLKKMPERVSQPIVRWDPRNPLPAESSDPDVVTVVDVRSWDDVELAYKWLDSGRHPFASVGLDSITEIQQRLVDDIAGLEQMRTQDWGTALRRGEGLVRNLRDLRNHPTNPLWAIVVIAGTADKSEKMRPMLQGQLAVKIAHHFDVVGFMQKRRNPETGERERLLWVDAYVEGVVAKDNTDDLSFTYGEYITNPDLSAMLQVLNATPGAAGQTNNPETPDNTEEGNI